MSRPLSPLLPLLFAGALLVDAAPSAGCAACGCGDPTLTAMGQEKPFRHRLRLALEERLGAHQSGTPAEHSLVNRTTLAAAYSPTAWLSLAASLPLVAVRSSRQASPARTTVGIGDLELLGRLLLFRDRRFSPRHTVAVLGGLKTPSGPRVDDSSGYPAPDDVQPGSGSWDPIVGVAYSYFGPSSAAFFSASYRHPTSGYRGYRRGATLGSSLAVQFAIGARGALVLGLDGSYSTQATLPSQVSAPDTGGLLVAAAPALLFAIHPDWLLRASLQVPLLERWRGQQQESATGSLSLIVDL
jgi:hypothetical protein